MTKKTLDQLINDTVIGKTFAPMIERFRVDYMEHTRKSYDRYQEAKATWAPRKFTEEQWNGMSRWARAGNTERAQRNAFRKEHPLGVRYTTGQDYDSRTGDYGKPAFNQEFAEKDAQAFAEAQFAGFICKFTRKVGDFDDVTIDFLSGGNCVMNGTIEGMNIRIDQQTVWKHSNRGTLFCQFPARIYVDGQFTPAKKFREMLDR